MTKRRFTAVLQGTNASSATFVSVPDSVMKRFGGRVRVPVVVEINGASHRTTICNMGLGPMIGVPAVLRNAAGIAEGERITLAISEDTRERTVDLPRDFAKAMTAAERRAYDAMAYTHRKEYVLWIEDAKRPETRLRRIEHARSKLKERLTAKK